MHGWFKRFDGDKGLQFAKWCDVATILAGITQGDLDEAIDAFEDARSGKHDEETGAFEEAARAAEEAAEAREEEVGIRAAQQRGRGSSPAATESPG